MAGGGGAVGRHLLTSEHTSGGDPEGSSAHRSLHLSDRVYAGDILFYIFHP